MNIRLKQVGLLLALFIVGSCSNDMIETSNNSSLIEESYDEIDLNSLKSEFSFALARVLNESEGVRKLIKEEVIKQFDYDYDVLYMLVKDKKLSGGGTLEEFLSKYMSKENLLALYKEMPTLTVFVPVLPNDIFSAEKWNVAQEVPFVAYKSKENQILFVDNAGKVNTIKSNGVYCIYEDRNNQLWIGTENGLYIFDKKKESFERINGFGIENTLIRSISEDNKGNIWATSLGNGIYKYTPKNKKLRNYRESQNIGLTSDFSTKVLTDLKGDIGA